MIDRWAVLLAAAAAVAFSCWLLLPYTAEMTLERKAKYGDWAVVAGASEGLGAAWAEEIASHGLNVLMLARSSQKLTSAAEGIRASYPDVLVDTKAVDLTTLTEDQVKQDIIGGRHIGLLVFNAAHQAGGTFLSRSLDEHRKTTRLNIDTLLTMVHPIATHMKHRGHGGIVLMGSIAGVLGSGYYPTYSSSKSYIASFSRALWYELAKDNIDVLGCLAGATTTPSYLSAVERAGANRSKLIEQSPETVVKECLAALGRTGAVATGWRNKLSHALLKHVLPSDQAVQLISHVTGIQTHGGGIEVEDNDVAMKRSQPMQKDAGQATDAHAAGSATEAKERNKHEREQRDRAQKEAKEREMSQKKRERELREKEDKARLAFETHTKEKGQEKIQAKAEDKDIVKEKVKVLEKEKVREKEKKKAKGRKKDIVKEKEKVKEKPAAKQLEKEKVKDRMRQKEKDLEEARAKEREKKKAMEREKASQRDFASRDRDEEGPWGREQSEEEEEEEKEKAEEEERRRKREAKWAKEREKRKQAEQEQDRRRIEQQAEDEDEEDEKPKRKPKPKRKKNPHLPTRSQFDALEVSGRDETGYEHEFGYRPNGKSNLAVVDCSGWDTADANGQAELFDESLTTLLKSGYVVLENLLPKGRVQEVNDEFRRIKDKLPNGMTFKRLRARRTMTVAPFEGVWKEEWLTRHPLVMRILADYVRNSLDSVTDEDATQQAMADWIKEGSPIETFQAGGKYGNGRPWLDLMVIIDTPPGAPPQVRHRDVIKPGPAASVGVHIPLTPLQVEPVNGAIGFTPGSQVLSEAGGEEYKRDVMGAVPQGSVILYDSFTEHHGLANNSTEPRAALFAWYRVPGVYSGHTDENFGKPGLEATMSWRRHIEKELNPLVHEARETEHGRTLPHKGFPLDAELVEWGEEHVCFSYDKTTDKGRMHKGMFFCDECWSASDAEHGGPPEPKPSNVEKPKYRADDFKEEMIISLESKGMNIRPSRKRHKLTLLRERGVFLPVDPTSEWLEEVPREPQPENWKIAMRKALGEIPRTDGFDA